MEQVVRPTDSVQLDEQKPPFRIRNLAFWLLFLILAFNFVCVFAA